MGDQLLLESAGGKGIKGAFDALAPSRNQRSPTRFTSRWISLKHPIGYTHGLRPPSRRALQCRLSTPRGLWRPGYSSSATTDRCERPSAGSSGAQLRVELFPSAQEYLAREPAAPPPARSRHERCRDGRPRASTRHRRDGEVYCRSCSSRGTPTKRHGPRPSRVRSPCSKTARRVSPRRDQDHAGAARPRRAARWSNELAKSSLAGEVFLVDMSRRSAD